MKKILTTKKRVVIAAGAGVAVLVTGGTAFAYFTSSGTGTGSANVGSASLTVSHGTFDSNNPLYPGGSAENMTFTVTNTGNTPVNLSKSEVTAKILTFGTGGDVQNSDSSDAPGCLAAWFNTGTIALSSNVIGTGSGANTATVTVPISMLDPTTPPTNQDACQRISGPRVELDIAKEGA